MTDAELKFIEVGQTIPCSIQSQMFGKPCFKIAGKAFMCFFENEMVFKLTGDAHSKAINLEGAQLFDPSRKGRPMKEWVQVPFVHSDSWYHFAKMAAEYCAGN